MGGFYAFGYPSLSSCLMKLTVLAFEYSAGFIVGALSIVVAPFTRGGSINAFFAAVAITFRAVLLEKLLS